MKKKLLVVTGGGTGGHVYPGLAVAKSLQADHPDWDVVFVGANGGLEEKIVPANHYPLHLISIGRFHSSVGRWQQLVTLLKMPFALFSAVRLLIKLKPTAVLGVGGFASFPFLIVSVIFRVKTFIWEGNAYPGLVNRYLSKWVDKNFLVFADSKKYIPKRSELVGLPVREEFFKFKKDKTPSPPYRVLVFGGSQGSQAINKVVQEMIIQFNSVLKDFQFIHQTGNNNFALINQKYQEQKIDIKCVPYINDMPQLLNDVHICICRSGASTVAEMCATQTPAIFIPLPTAADDHQTKNAKAVVDVGGGLLLNQADLNANSLYDNLIRFRSDPHLSIKMQEALAKFDFHGVDKKIAESIVGGSL